MKKLAKLSSWEEKSWEHAFTYYLNKGKTDEQADQLAWKDMLKEFPRLNKFDGISV